MRKSVHPAFYAFENDPTKVTAKAAEMLLAIEEPVQTWIVRSVGNITEEEEFSIVKHDPAAVEAFALDMSIYPDVTQSMIGLINDRMNRDEPAFKITMEYRTYFFTKAQDDWFYGCKPR